jgi:hypothetical protein
MQPAALHYGMPYPPVMPMPMPMYGMPGYGMPGFPGMEGMGGMGYPGMDPNAVGLDKLTQLYKL